MRTLALALALLLIGCGGKSTQRPHHHEPLWIIDQGSTVGGEDRFIVRRFQCECGAYIDAATTDTLIDDQLIRRSQ